MIFVNQPLSPKIHIYPSLFDITEKKIEENAKKADWKNKKYVFSFDILWNLGMILNM